MYVCMYVCIYILNVCMYVCMKALLADLGMFSEKYSNDNRIVYMKSLVNLLVHQSRFINLQRYVLYVCVNCMYVCMCESLELFCEGMYGTAKQSV